MWDWLLNVTCNDISVIYVTAHTCAGGLKKLDLRSVSQRHRHSVGFFNVPVQAPTRASLFIRLFRKTAPFSRLLRHAGDTKDTFISPWYTIHVLLAVSTNFQDKPRIYFSFFDKERQLKISISRKFLIVALPLKDRERNLTKGVYI